MPTEMPGDAASEMPFDLAELNERTCDDHELLVELVDLFRADTPEQMQRLRAAIDAGDTHVTERLAHHLRGSLCNFAAHSAANAASALEAMGRLGCLDGAGRKFDDLGQHVDRLLTALDQHLAATKS